MKTGTEKHCLKNRVNHAKTIRYVIVRPQTKWKRNKTIFPHRRTILESLFLLQMQIDLNGQDRHKLDRWYWKLAFYGYQSTDFTVFFLEIKIIFFIALIRVLSNLTNIFSNFFPPTLKIFPFPKYFGPVCVFWVNVIFDLLPVNFGLLLFSKFKLFLWKIFF